MENQTMELNEIDWQEYLQLRKLKIKPLETPTCKKWATDGKLAQETA